MCIEYSLTAKDIQEQAEFLKELHGKYGSYFCSKTKSLSKQSYEYLKGQLLCEKRRNMSKMEKQTSDLNNQALSHFISNSPWDEEPLIEKIGNDVSEIICKDGPAALIFDESGFKKQGNQSVGVARQFCGNLGKVDNCQVGVFLALANFQQVAMIDKRLYLPKIWTEDKKKRRKAGIPDDVVFQTKSELAIEMLLQAKQRQIPFRFVSFDCYYGLQAPLLTKLDGSFEYYADIPCDTRVYLEYPKVGIPPKKGVKGRTPSKLKVIGGTPIEVQELLSDPQFVWDTFKIRNTQRGELWVKFAALRVYRIDNKLPVQSPVWLLIKQDLESNEIRFSFSNASADTPKSTLAQNQCLRYWVERSIEDAKQLAGMAEYQFIGWRAWHHHMALVFLAMLFLLLLQQRLINKAPMLTLFDARDILLVVIPRKTLSYQEAVEVISRKHLNRFFSRRSHYNKQKVRLRESGILM